jgi:hypothetical protein
MSSSSVEADQKKAGKQPREKKEVSEEERAKLRTAKDATERMAGNMQRANCMV